MSTSDSSSRSRSRGGRRALVRQETSDSLMRAAAPSAISNSNSNSNSNRSSRRGSEEAGSSSGSASDATAADEVERDGGERHPGQIKQGRPGHRHRRGQLPHPESESAMIAREATPDDEACFVDADTKRVGEHTFTFPLFLITMTPLQR